MGRVIVFGETLVDLFARPKEQHDSNDSSFGLDGFPGGAPSNVAVHLAANNVPVTFLSGLADDPLGRRLRGFLEGRNIDIVSATDRQNTTTPLATVANLPDGERTFRLYFSGSVLEHIDVANHLPALFDGTSWLHLGGVILALAAGERATRQLMSAARTHRVITSFDVNARPDIWADSSVDPAVIGELLKHIDIIKLSDEDLQWMQHHVHPKLTSAHSFLEAGCRLVVFTKGPEGATILSPTCRTDIAPPNVQVVDTTGAGDAFMSGLIIALHRRSITAPDALTELDATTLTEVGRFASDAAGAVLSIQGAIPLQT